MNSLYLFPILQAWSERSEETQLYIKRIFVNRRNSNAPNTLIFAGAKELR
jgi:hypothetical protein